MTTLVHEKPLDIGGLADRWAVAPGTIYRMIKRGDIRAFKLGPKIFRVNAAEAHRLDPIMATRNKRTADGHVYFVQATESGKIKIGFSTRKIDRLQRIMTECPEPVKVLAAIPGSMKDEKALHRRFEKQRHCGEWFRPSAELIAFIEGLPK